MARGVDQVDKETILTLFPLVRMVDQVSILITQLEVHGNSTVEENTQSVNEHKCNLIKVDYIQKTSDNTVTEST